MDYIKLAQAIDYEIEIKKSRFICYLFPIADEADFNDQLAKLRKQHPKASHHCSAMILDIHGQVYRTSDDGEPGGTAGIPMLEVLNHHHLRQIGAVVVRYFGGTKLGTGGLIRAYSQSVSQCLAQAYEQRVIVHSRQQTVLTVGMSYKQVDSVRYFIDQSPLAVHLLDCQYADTVVFKLTIQDDQCQKLIEQLTDQFHASLTILELGHQQLDIPLNSPIIKEN
ncbi:YigZ family protein [Vaginisenegalia massiliensis]|uniref:YigZ family protein n=1 Tax=Vaginisenegalia massiliensis TaxID=2058294 RepID=UPI000F522A31|nr:YigZ family protein [Vaginisenegalia massiliensis]